MGGGARGYLPWLKAATVAQGGNRGVQIAKAAMPEVLALALAIVSSNAFASRCLCSTDQNVVASLTVTVGKVTAFL
jgi:hypothetical protein